MSDRDPHPEAPADAPPAPEAAPPAPAPPPSEPVPSSFGLERPITLALYPIAIFAVVAVLLGRTIAPAFAGVLFGVSRAIHAISLAGALVSQTFAFAAMLLSILAIVAAAKSRLPIVARLAAIALGGFAVLPTMWAVHQPVPALSAALVGGSASLLALLAAPAARRAPFARVPALVVILVAVGGLLRVAGVALALRGASLVPHARVLSTASFLADALALAAAIGWITSLRRRLTSPFSVVVLAGALLATRAALAGHAESLRPVDVFFWRAAERLTTRPMPAVPLGFQLFVAFLCPLVAIWALSAVLALGPRAETLRSTRAVVAALSGAVALALVAHGAVEMPPSALMLIIAALGLALAAHDGRGLWAAIDKR